MLIKHSPPLPRRNKKYTERILTKSPSLGEIIEDVCVCFGQDIEMIKSPSQCNRHITPRRIYCYVAHVLTNETCASISNFINRDHTTYLDRVDQCLGWFEINEASFMDDWNIYISKSAIWREYYLLKKQALIDGCSKYIEDLRREEIYWKRQVKQAKEQKRKWERQLEKATKHQNTPKIEAAKSNFEKYKNRLDQGKQSLSSLRLRFYKFI